MGGGGEPSDELVLVTLFLLILVLVGSVQTYLSVFYKNLLFESY